jgi:hypothetical protein
VRHIDLVTLLNWLASHADTPENLADALLAPLAPSLLNCQRRVAGFSVERIKARLDHLLGWALSRSTGGSGPGGGKRPAARRTS